jgi:hypothetical protein
MVVMKKKCSLAPSIIIQSLTPIANRYIRVVCIDEKKAKIVSVTIESIFIDRRIRVRESHKHVTHDRSNLYNGWLTCLI